MNTHWVRVAYVGVFLLAVLAVFTTWGQIGGQGHLDIIPWYWKLTLGCGLSASIVGLTGALSSDARALNRRSLVWLAVVVAFAGAITAVTVQAHLNEGIEEPESEEGTTAHRRSGVRPLARYTRPLIR
jgi:hypothetical protein